MVDTLAQWEYVDNVKVTLKDGEVVYCDIAEWIYDDPEELVLMPNEKTTNSWLVNRAVGNTVDITEIDTIEKLNGHSNSFLEKERIIKEVHCLSFDDVKEIFIEIEDYDSYDDKLRITRKRISYARNHINDEKIVFKWFHENTSSDYIDKFENVFKAFKKGFRNNPDGIKNGFCSALLVLNNGKKYELVSMRDGFETLLIEARKMFPSYNLYSPYYDVKQNTEYVPTTKTVEDQMINESEEFKKEMEKLRASGKNLCAFVSFYPNGGGKIYTYLVDAYFEGGHWYLEDKKQEVYVMEFGELADDELPVPKDKMKHLRWEQDSVIKSPPIKKVWAYDKTLSRSDSMEVLDKAKDYLDKKYPTFRCEMSAESGGDAAVYTYTKDDKIIRLINDCFVDANWIEANFELDTEEMIQKGIIIIYEK